MKISQEYKSLIQEEFENVSESLKGAKNPNEFFYFFSASFGILNRVMNIQCDPTLVFMHQILQSLHQTLFNRFVSANAPGEPFGLPAEFLAKAAEILESLNVAFIKGSEELIYQQLARAANLTYAATGNGYYLYLREKLKI